MITMHLEPDFFNLVVEGKKRVEFRRYDKKRKLIKSGDILRFIDSENSNTKSVLAKVITVKSGYMGCSLDTLVNSVHPDFLGTKQSETFTAIERIYNRSPENPGSFCAIFFDLIETEDNNMESRFGEAICCECGRPSGRSLALGCQAKCLGCLTKRVSIEKIKDKIEKTKEEAEEQLCRTGGVLMLRNEFRADISLQGVDTPALILLIKRGLASIEVQETATELEQKAVTLGRKILKETI